MDVIEIGSRNRDVLNVSSRARSVVEVSRTTGGSKGIAGTPFAVAKDNVLTLYMVTYQQIENLHVYTADYDIGFVVDKSTTGYALKYSSDSPEAIAGQMIGSGFKSMYDDEWILKELVITLPTGWIIEEVFMDPIEGDLLKEGDAWRMADIRRKLNNIRGGGGSALLEEFFGLPEALPEIEVATEQEVKDINDDVMGALYGYGKVTVTIHSLMRIGTAQNSQSSQNSEQSQGSEQSQNSENAQSTGYITQDLASVIYVDPEKTWSANGYPTLYDDEGEPIRTATTNPAQGDEVFNYQIQES